MNRYRPLITILSLSLVIYCLTKFIHPSSSQSIPKETSALCHAVLPHAHHFRKVKTPFTHYQGWQTDLQTGTDVLHGIAFFTTDISPDIQGYGGPIKILAGLDSKGLLTKVKIIEHNETSSFIKKLDPFISQFEGKKAADPFQLGVDIDGMSQATVSSNAITKALHVSLQKAVPLLERRPDASNKKIWVILTTISICLFVWSVSFNKTIAVCLLIIGALFFLGLFPSLFDKHKPVAPLGEAPNLIAPPVQSSKEAASFKERMKEKGIILHPAKYWKETD